MKDQQERSVEILLVEDNPGDARLMVELLNEAKILNTMHVVSDGVEAVAFLKQQGDFSAAPRPDLVFLDLNLPRMGGLDVLQVIKADDALRRIPVIVLTTSSAEEDVVKSYDFYANAYVVKPVDLNKFIHIIKTIEDFWIRVVRLPSNGERP